MACLYRDAFGIPHLRADSILDLAHAQGRVTVADRAWQLEWLRRRANGTTAEVAGEPGLSWDRFSRRMRTVETAQRAFAACTEETQRFVSAYVDGVNEALAELDPGTVPELSRLRIAPGEWEPWMPLATFLAQHLLFANIGGLLWKRLAADVLGDDVRFLSHQDPTASGSNAWAAGGERTASGLPLIGGDPHRIIEQPGVYQQVRLACEDPVDRFDVVGYTFVGVPGVQHFAHAGEVAWAITNACADYQYVTDDDGSDVVERHTETIRVLGADPVEIDVVATARGLVFEDGLAVRTSSWELGELGFDAILGLLRARTVDDVDRALDSWVEPVNNAVIADRAGAVRYRIAGRVPVRDGSGAWAGWLTEPNRADVPRDGHVVTANEWRGPESDAIGTVFAAPYRADRLHALLDGRSGLTRDDYVAFHNDALLQTVPMVTALVPGAFDDFDGVMDSGSAGAARYAAFRSALVRRLCDEPVFAKLFDPPADHQHEEIFAPWLNAAYRIGLALPRLANETTAGHRPFGIDLVAHAQAALAEVDAAGTPATWGDTHVTDPVHWFALLTGHDYDALPRLPLSGDADCVRCCVSYPAITDECSRGSVARYVWDLADRTVGGWVVPTGADGRPGDAHHHDQLPLWAAGELAPIVDDWDVLTEVGR
ncbi:penicillin acylase family protein [Nocardioides bizhenqiangii]|uniref:Penicillin acylase family protein n=1 Tax=Nocardioides bizhenqiangii TaxID=3095076 RepID=A0ABZ0ZTU8_9ACTN|nr:penicillin acylase family protein [Nocardioides sp. HM61]WQQ27746.1 penicillin acylase family protein [Nocardioides sp. HM61]